MKTFFERFIKPPFQLKHGGVTSVVDSQLKELYVYPSIFAGQTSLFEVQQHSVKVNNGCEHLVTGEWKKLCTGNGFTIGLTKDGQLCGWGTNTYGQLGIDPEACKKLDIPTLLLADIYDVAVGSDHVVIVIKDTDGFKIKSFGSNCNKQITQDGLMFFHTPIQIVKGSYASLPSIFAYGNITGITFNNNTEILGDNTFLKIPLDEHNKLTISNYSLVSIGLDTLFLQDTNNTLYGIGRNDVYQLGVNHNRNTTFEDIHNSIISNHLIISTIHSSDQGTVVVDDHNNIHTWGKCADQIYQTPTQILENDEWFKAVIGKTFIAAINTDGYTYCLGSIEEPLTPEL